MNQPLFLPAGFRFAGVHCGIKSDATKEDLSLVVADQPAVTAGMYTQNLVYAAPVAYDRARTPSTNIRVVVTNSGNANACTGQRGLDDAHEMARLAAAACGAGTEQALVMSTGIIGVHLPMPKIAAGVTAAAARLARDEASFQAAARGITTTDKFPKIASRSIALGGRTVRLAGMAKGAGMIGPRMATMLCLALTDAPLAPATSQSALAAAVETSFNCISVEGHMSTNDTVLLLASGAAGGSPLAGDELVAFRAALAEMCIELARMIPDDGEGATHLIAIEVRGARTREDAHRAAQTIANSNLVKAAVAGADPNWGRIVSAAGYSGAQFDPAEVGLRLNGHELYRRGAPLPFDAEAVSHSIRERRETAIELHLGSGDGCVRFWTSDLTVDYVRLNSDYHT